MHPGGSRLEGDLPKAVLKYPPDLMRVAPLLNVISIVNAAPPNGGHWAARADVSRWLMNVPVGNERLACIKCQIRSRTLQRGPP